MHFSGSKRRAVGNALFGITFVVLLIVAGSGFYLYGTKPSTQGTVTVTVSESMSHSSSSAMNETAAPAVGFRPAQGQMFGQGWLVVSPLGNGSYAVAVHATGLESASMGDYIVEAAQNSGQMAMVPIAGANDMLSEFTADSGGNGNFFIVLHQAPSSEYESVSIVYLPNMEMQNATVVASASLAM